MNPQQTISLKGDEKLAQKVNITFVDDLDGTEAIETVRFALDGKEYEIDLSEDNAKELRDGLQKFVQAARRGGSTGGRGGKRGGGQSSTSNRDETQAIRLWAAENGIAVNTRGRISSDVVEKYRAANAA
jgi:hypothetical protein